MSLHNAMASLNLRFGAVLEELKSHMQTIKACERGVVPR